MNADREGLDSRLDAADPLAIFQRMNAPAVGDGEVAAMKNRVAELRRARSLAHDPSYAWAFDPKPRRSLVGWRGAALLALLLLPAALLQGPGAGSWNAPGLAVAVAGPVELPAAFSAAAAALPLVEDLDPQSGEVLLIEGEDLSVVVVH